MKNVRILFVLITFRQQLAPLKFLLLKYNLRCLTARAEPFQLNFMTTGVKISTQFRTAVSAPISH
jgi:hypothetical protein